MNAIRTWRAALVGALLVIAMQANGIQPASAAKEFSIEGILDCGEESGKACLVGDTIALIVTDKRSRETILVDISWIRAQIRAFRQDDSVTVEIHVQPDGTYQAIGIAETQSGEKRKKGPDDTLVEEAPVLCYCRSVDAEPVQR
ncbi:MAG: hypothetical protein U0821_25625 [Chloroflexota bacterium]